MAISPRSSPLLKSPNSENVELSPAQFPCSPQGKRLYAVMQRSMQTPPPPQTPPSKKTFTRVSSPTTFSHLNTPPSKEKENHFIPPTPLKPKSSRSPANHLFQTILQNAKVGNLTINGVDASLSKIGSGSYVKVFELTAPVSLVEGKSNNELVVKVFKKERCNKDLNLLKSFLQNSLTFYGAAQKLGVPVATIFNEDSALDDGYYLQERIPDQIDVLNISHREQAREMFFTFLKNKEVLFDLRPSNLMVTKENKVVLIDFVEELDDAWHIFCIDSLKEWCKLYLSKNPGKDALKFLTEFTKGFEAYGYDPKWNKDIV